MATPTWAFTSRPWPSGWRWRWSPASAAAWWAPCSTSVWSGPQSCGSEHPWLLWCLPAGGAGDRGLLQADKDGGPGHQRHHRRGTPRKAPVHLAAARHLPGDGSAPTCAAAAPDGRARLSRWAAPSAAMRGSLFNLDDRDLRTATMAGMAAFFSALFGTPLAGHGVCHRGHQHRRGVPRGADSMPDRLRWWPTGCLWPVGGGAHPLLRGGAGAGEAGCCVRVAVLGVGCALVSVLFCRTLHFAEHQMKKRLPNPWLRVRVGGGLAVIALTYLCGHHGITTARAWISLPPPWSRALPGRRRFC